MEPSRNFFMAVLSLFSHPSHFQEDGRNYVLVRTRFSPCSPGPGYGYSYAYDGLNRLVLAQSLDSRGSGTGIANNHSSWYDYDLMGNVTSVVRNGLLRPAFSFGRMDELSLEYDGNRLLKVTDTSSGTPLYHNAFHYVDGSDASVEFEYDSNGNLTADLDKGVELSYNRLNLPVEAVCGEGAFACRYNRDGVKLVERFGYGLSSSDGMLMPVPVGLSAQPLSVSGEYRFDEAAYSGDIVRLRSGTGRIGDRADNLTGEELQVRHADGYVSFTGQLPTYHYFIRDYQGNVVVVVSSEGDVEQRTHYYPYGGWYGESTEPLAQDRKYGGKELELTAGLNWYDFGARLQRPDLCRFQTMDPLAEKYYGVSPYAYCGGNPVNRTDPTGMEWEDEEEAENLKASVKDKIDDLLGRIDRISRKLSGGNLSDRRRTRMERNLEDMNNRVAKLNKSLSDIDMLGNDMSYVYAFSNTDNGVGEHLIYFKDGKVYIQTTSDALSLHEIRHVAQYLEKGLDLHFNQAGFLCNPGLFVKGENREKSVAYMEVEAYQHQYAYSKQFPGIFHGGYGINGINAYSVGNIVNGNSYVYPAIHNYVKNMIDMELMK